MTWRVLIADDEPAARRGVRQLLAPFSDFAVAGECRNGEEVLAALDAVQPHVIFLDIQMPGADAFEVIRRRTPERMPIVVFLTAYDEYALPAFEAQALDYLVKPVTTSRFDSTIRRVTRQLQHATPHVPGVVVTTPAGIVVLSLSDIDWIESADNYARVWTNGRSYLIRQSLRELEERLHEHGFVRAHRRALVRLDRIRSLNGDSALLASGAAIPISRRQRAAFVAKLKDRSPQRHDR